MQLKVFLQALTGDATDGYDGCKGCGIKKARAALGCTNEQEYWSAVLATYAEFGQSEEDA